MKVMILWGNYSKEKNVFDKSTTNEVTHFSSMNCDLVYENDIGN